MNKSDAATEYFEEVDSNYVLELNLQRIRLELIKLLEEGEKEECFTCNKLKCICKAQVPSAKSPTFSNCCSSLSNLSTISKITDSSENETYNKSKSTSVTNKSYEEIQAWVQSCTPEKEVVDTALSKKILERGIYVTWPPTQTSIWSDSAFTIQPENLRKHNTVNEFFKKFGDGQNLCIPELISGTINLQAIYINDEKPQIKFRNALIQKLRAAPKQATEYSYF